ncbi:hypothetical protein [Psychrobacter sanguinis]|uniref:hypothetical protein n=1 Tax=Psychrobacter sanguinis TaxID=861445 RepID=UPI002A75FBC5|nr:hypothetical protein [Psychrobacter sanguinis]MDY3307087.1 hypothetical protein [Psychrobacter sanguinis]
MSSVAAPLLVYKPEWLAADKSILNSILPLTGAQPEGIVLEISVPSVPAPVNLASFTAMVDVLTVVFVSVGFGTVKPRVTGALDRLRTAHEFSNITLRVLGVSRDVNTESVLTSPVIV